MATYIELHGLRGAAGADQLQQKIAVAICIKANAIAKLHNILSSATTATFFSGSLAVMEK